MSWADQEIVENDWQRRRRTTARAIFRISWRDYIEANEALSKKDFICRIKICRKEAKESRYWLRLIEVMDEAKERDTLVQEAQELMNIFGAIVRKSE